MWARIAIHQKKKATSIPNQIQECVKIHCSWMLMTIITTSPFRVECFPGRSQAVFYELNEGKLPSCQHASVILLTYDKSVLFLLATSPKRVRNTYSRDQEALHCSVTGVPGTSKTPPGKPGGQSLQIYLALQVTKVSHGTFKTLPPSASEHTSSPGPSDFTQSLQGALPY